MGIIGLGSIGLAVAERAVGFGIQVQSLAKPDRRADVVARAEDLGITMCDSLSELLSSSDVVSLHVPASDETRHLVDADFLAQMRPGRDPAQHLAGRRRRRGGAARGLGRRVRCAPASTSSPTNRRRASGSWESALARHPAVVGTHHIGASTEQAQRAIAAGVAEIVESFSRGEVRHCVNLEPSRLGSATLTIRHLDRVGVLAQVLDRLSGARPQRRAHGEPHLPRRGRGGRDHRRRRPGPDALLADLRGDPPRAGRVRR